MLGSLLGNRYRIVELIGEGGMALVYRAECSLLHRDVAIKILRPQFENDHDFVERFRREAQAAASLSHPNVVNIYDVGQENGKDYIVMEYIQGQNLKEIIRQENFLPIDRVVQISRQICEALLHAHQHQIIHRDIKSQNILVTSEDLIKVTDFGIARALSETGLTQTGSVLGSAQYISPEQAKGVEVSAQADLYSLGCVMYEMLTGHLPFSGETPIAIALKHLQEAPVPPGQLRKNIPPALEHVVLKALQKDLKERYQTAKEMLKEIVAVEKSLEFVSGASLEDPTQVISPDELLKKKWHSRLGDWLWVAGGVTVLSMFAYFWYAYIAPHPSVVVPNLIGKNIVEARRLVREKGLYLDIEKYLFDEKYPENYVIYQKPDANYTMRRNQHVKVHVSKGSNLVMMPDVTRLELRLARIKLEELGLEILPTVPYYTQEVEPGIVMEQNPSPNQMVPQSTKVILSVSAYSEDKNEQELPNFYGLTLQEAERWINDLGLSLGQVDYKNSNSPEGIVVGQEPAAGTLIPPGSVVNLSISRGKRPLPSDQV